MQVWFLPYLHFFDFTLNCKECVCTYSSHHGVFPVCGSSVFTGNSTLYISAISLSIIRYIPAIVALLKYGCPKCTLRLSLNLN